jgi:proteasome lid subunit RPN8/RPN11
VSHSLTLIEPVYAEIEAHVAKTPHVEVAGFVFAKTSNTGSDTRFIAREFRPVDRAHIIKQSASEISVTSQAYCPALQHADESKQSFWFFHSHPKGITQFSRRDNEEETKLFRTAFVRAPNQIGHGSLVLPRDGLPFGRVWLSDGRKIPLDRVRVIGARFIFADTESDQRPPILPFFDRQVRAFGPDVQRLLERLRIGVVGCGGTGSAVCEQLLRLGIGTLGVYDGGDFESSNANRVYGSITNDDGVAKVKIIERLVKTSGLPTNIKVFNSSIYHRETALTLREYDIIFGCTDDEFGRSILNQLALRYAIPVLDLGVKVDSKDEIIQSVTGRVTMLYPGTACLFCRGRINPQRVAEESRAFFTPDEARELRRQGYAHELVAPNPAVIPFTSAVASSAVSELLHRLTGFMGLDRPTTEIIHLFHQTEIGRNSVAGSADCQCRNPKGLGSGGRSKLSWYAMGEVRRPSLLKRCFWRLLRLATGDRPFYRHHRFVGDLPSASPTKAHEIVFVEDGGKLKWAALLCPCGCGEIIAVNLMRSHYPTWQVRFERDDSVSFQPSLWITEERCGSHFIIHRGQIEWCSYQAPEPSVDGLRLTR